MNIRKTILSTLLSVALIGSATSSVSALDTNSSLSTPDSSELLPYSAMDMEVYPNSRVTSIKQNGNGFTVEGYMFENHVNCDLINSVWREIVLINAENPDPSYAYRMQVTPVFNDWLNRNMTATDNGKLRLSYSSYKVTVNPYNMNTYVNNVRGATVAPGTYYLYMRISNGSESYLFPLVDRVLSDGTTMENTGTLPNGFTVYDTSSRTLSYTVSNTSSSNTGGNSGNNTSGGNNTGGSSSSGGSSSGSSSTSPWEQHQSTPIEEQGGTVGEGQMNTTGEYKCTSDWCK